MKKYKKNFKVFEDKKTHIFNEDELSKAQEQYGKDRAEKQFNWILNSIKGHSTFDNKEISTITIPRLPNRKADDLLFLNDKRFKEYYEQQKKGYEKRFKESSTVKQGMKRNIRNLEKVLNGLYYNQNVLKVNDPIYDKVIDEYLNWNLIKTDGAGMPENQLAGITAETYIRGITELSGNKAYGFEPSEHEIDDKGIDLCITDPENPKQDIIIDIKSRNRVYNPFEYTWKKDQYGYFDIKDNAEMSYRDMQEKHMYHHVNDLFMLTFVSLRHGSLQILNTLEREMVEREVHNPSMFERKDWDNRKDNAKTTSYLLKRLPEKGTVFNIDDNVNSYVKKKIELTKDACNKNEKAKDTRTDEQRKRMTEYFKKQVLIKIKETDGIPNDIRRNLIRKVKETNYYNEEEMKQTINKSLYGALKSRGINLTHDMALNDSVIYIDVPEKKSRQQER